MRRFFLSLLTNDVVAEEYNVMVNRGELNGAAEHLTS
jgi:hypothetical protein